MVMALTLSKAGDTDREIYMFDTFEGMVSPTVHDKAMDGTPAQTCLERDPAKKGPVWAVAGIDDVSRNLTSTGYRADRLHYVKGPVEETLPALAPQSPVALLRLDTDWYESTKHELTHLFPLLCSGGVLIVDDYGHWQGAKKAVDEYLTSIGKPYYLHRIDYTGRMLIKQ